MSNVFRSVVCTIMTEEKTLKFLELVTLQHCVSEYAHVIEVAKNR